MLEMIFWLSLICMGYTYAGYPLLLWVWARLKPAPPRRQPFRGSVAIVLAARNEEATITRRLEELCRHLRNSGLEGRNRAGLRWLDRYHRGQGHEVLQSTGLVRVLELPDNVGKSAALTIACQSVHSEVVVFADARQSWADDALTQDAGELRRSRRGCGERRLGAATGAGVMAGVGLYWHSRNGCARPRA